MDLLGVMTLKAKWAILEKIQTGAWLREDIYTFFEKKTLEFLDLSLYGYSVWRKKSFTCGNCATFSDTPCLGNSITKSQDPWIRETVKKGKFVTKIFFSDNVEWSSKNLWKMIFADVKANKNNTKIKDLVVASYKFL